MKMLKVIFFAMAIVTALGACAKKDPPTIIDQSDNSDCSRFKDGCQQ
jgi:hypothetical protein